MPPPQKQTTGPIDRVPCPWCGQPNDFRADAGEEDGGAAGSWGASGLEVGARCECDYCHRFFKILAKQKIMIIKLVPSN